MDSTWLGAIFIKERSGLSMVHYIITSKLQKKGQEMVSVKMVR